jgi:DNA-binding IclR family transcriptional regulator
MRVKHESMKTIKTSKQIQYKAPALEKGLDIIEYLAAQPVARSQTEIAEALKRSQGEIYRMLACLEQRGYVQKDAGAGSFRLTLRLYELAHRQNSTALLRRAALLPMDALAEETGQSCHLSVQHGSLLLVLMERTPTRRVCLAVGEGTTLPLSQSASGMVLLSRMTDEVAQQVLKDDPHYLAAELLGRKAINASLLKIRETGYFIVKSDVTAGGMDIAISVGVDNTDTAAVIDIPFISRADESDARSELYLKAAQTCAAQINRNLGIEA